jgi:hypothetical protein
MHQDIKIGYIYQLFVIAAQISSHMNAVNNRVKVLLLPTILILLDLSYCLV